jgi:hypothetical protein
MYDIPHALTNIQGLFNDTKPGEPERSETQINDDKALLKEMRDSISTSKDLITARYVLMCPVFFAINCGHSSLHYMKTKADSLNTLQDIVISASRAGVGPRSHECRSSIDLPDTVADGYYNPNKYAYRGCTEDGGGLDLRHRYSEPSEVGVRVECCFRVCILFRVS